MKQIPMILRVLGMEETNENEVFNLMIELESSRTEITLKTIMDVRRSHNSKE
jgi:hypothetical protein